MQKGQLLTECGHTVLGYAFVHDFGLTASYYLLCLNPVRQSMGKLLRGASCVASIQVNLWSRPGTSALLVGSVQGVMG